MERSGSTAEGRMGAPWGVGGGTGSSQVREGTDKGVVGAAPEEQRGRTGLRTVPAEVRAGGHGSLELS